MTLDEQVLTQTKEIREQLLEAERSLEYLRADYHHSIRLLHSRGGNMREIAEALLLSHQRVHQIVGADVEPEGGPGMGRRGHHGGPRGRHGGHRGGPRGIVGRFDAETQEVVTRASADARELSHGAVEAPHLLLALAEVDPRAGGVVAPAELRARVAAAYPQGAERRRGRMRFGHTAKHTLALAFHAATEHGDDRINARHLVVGLTRPGAPREEIEPLGVDLDALAQAVSEEQK
jgi:hypothetical protein